jgi:hypothetical protein
MFGGQEPTQLSFLCQAPIDTRLITVRITFLLICSGPDRVFPSTLVLFIRIFTLNWSYLQEERNMFTLLSHPIKVVGVRLSLA